MDQNIEEERRTLLLELQMILEVTRSINDNIMRSVELLQQNIPIGIPGNVDRDKFQRNYAELVTSNMTRLGEVLSLIDED